MSTFATQFVSLLVIEESSEPRTTTHDTRHTTHEPRTTKMLETLITSKTRIKLMLKFFLNSSSTGYLRGLAAEFNESTNAVRPELNRFEAAGLLTSIASGGKKIYQANTRHPLYGDINSLVRKYVGMDEILERVIDELGNPKEVFLIGDLARGIDSTDLSIVIVGNDIDLNYLEILVKKAQQLISRKVGYAVFTQTEFDLQYPHLNQENLLRVWQNKG